MGLPASVLALKRIFSTREIATMLGCSRWSLRRYEKGLQMPRGAVFEHLTYLTELLIILERREPEAENIRKWFTYSSSFLDYQSPLEVLGRPWKPTDRYPLSIRELAERPVPMTIPPRHCCGAGRKGGR